MRRVVVALTILLLTGEDASAGAWTVKRHHWQAFVSVINSSAASGFDNRGKRGVDIKFAKMLYQNWFEYGVTSRLTLFVVPNVVSGRALTPLAFSRGHNLSFQGGARLLLWGRSGKLSLQGSYKSAGPFDLSVSNGIDSGRQIELRLLYGTGFRLFGLDGFADVQVAQRWLASPRPNETPVDLTAGLWIDKDWMLMAQSFNVISAGDSRPPFTYYRSHKLELSLVQRLTPHWSLQMGAFYSPAGQNALVERGLQMSLWVQS
jgi:hypothetical protein